MNLFYTDPNPHIAAVNLNHPKLIRKMWIENLQMLSTCYRIRNMDLGYKSFNPAHECRMWLEESEQNFLWLVDHTLSILELVVKLSNGKKPSTKLGDPWELLDVLQCNRGYLGLPAREMTVPFLAMKNVAPDLADLYGVAEYLVSPVSGKKHVAYRGKSFYYAAIAYREFLQRKSYWKSDYSFVSLEEAA